MYKNYFKIAWRNLFRNKGFSLSNLLGLTIGMTSAILILLWVKDELSYDKSQKNYNEIYQVMANRNFSNQISTDQAVVFPLAKSLENRFPQIKNAVVTTFNQPYIISYGDKKLKKQGYTVSEHFFNIFSWKFIKGSPATAIADPSSIVLTRSAAKSLFGDEDPINKVVRIDNERDAKVSAILADLPGNSTFQFDCITTFNYSNDNVKQAMNEWVNSFSTVFIQTIPGADVDMLNKNINAVVKQHDPTDKVSTYFAFPMSKWRLYSDFKEGKNAGGMIEYVRLFTIIAIIILLIACVNFMNLSTARSEKRAKEVGIRKTLGSAKSQLVLQFFFESLILTFIAFIFSIISVYFLLPSFNTLVNKQLFIDLNAPFLWVCAFVIVIFTGVVAGSYPALYLSSFNPVKVLKGTFLAGKKAVLPRHILVVAQFVISILLISATIIIYQQIQHVKNRDIGYNPDNLIMIPSSPDTDKSYTVIKDKMLKSGLINSVTRASAPITDIWNFSPAPDWNGKPANANIIVVSLNADEDFTKTMGIKILEGKDFSGAPSDSSSMMINKAALGIMGLKNPIGTRVRYGPGGGVNYAITGVIDNVVMSSPYKPVDPMIMFYNPRNSNFVNIRLNRGIQPQNALRLIEAVFKKYNPAFPFEYQFVNQEFGKKFSGEELISKLTDIFAGLAIFICCLGLAGLASFTIEKRIREIGIRKVLGATLQQLLMLISKEFLKLVLIAFVIAVPLAWWFMNKWLEKYQYRINISIWMFGAVGLVILLLTLVVVTVNTMSAAMRNPLRSLRTE